MDTEYYNEEVVDDNPIPPDGFTMLFWGKIAVDVTEAAISFYS